MFNAAALKEFRKALRLTQSEVAAAIGVAPQTYANYEQARRTPDFDTLGKLAELFKVEITDLLVTERSRVPTTVPTHQDKDKEEEETSRGVVVQSSFLDIAARLAAAIDRQNEALERLARAQEADAEARLQGAEADKIDAQARLTTAGALEQLSKSHLLAQQNLSRAMSLATTDQEKFSHPAALPDAEEEAVAR